MEDLHLFLDKITNCHTPKYKRISFLANYRQYPSCAPTLSMCEDLSAQSGTFVINSVLLFYF